MPSELKRLRQVWSRLGKDDPLWAILSHENKRHGGWDLQEFFATGEEEIASLMHYCERFSRPQQQNSALDFGCGVGRLTRALALRYATVRGVDVSPSMIRQARILNARVENVRFIENKRAHLGFIADASIDLVYSNITLQHMSPKLQRAYLAELLRVLTPAGLGVFQLVCAHSNDLRGWLYKLLPNRLLNPIRRHVHGSPAVFEMHVLPESTVETLVAAAGKQILHVENVESAGAGFRSRRFFVG